MNDNSLIEKLHKQAQMMEKMTNPYRTLIDYQVSSKTFAAMANANKLSSYITKFEPSVLTLIANKNQFYPWLDNFLAQNNYFEECIIRQASFTNQVISKLPRGYNIDLDQISKSLSILQNYFDQISKDEEMSAQVPENIEEEINNILTKSSEFMDSKESDKVFSDETESLVTNKKMTRNILVRHLFRILYYVLPIVLDLYLFRLNSESSEDQTQQVVSAIRELEESIEDKLETIASLHEQQNSLLDRNNDLLEEISSHLATQDALHQEQCVAKQEKGIHSKDNNISHQEPNDLK